MNCRKRKFLSLDLRTTIHCIEIMCWILEIKISYHIELIHCCQVSILILVETRATPTVQVLMETRAISTVLIPLCWAYQLTWKMLASSWNHKIAEENSRHTSLKYVHVWKILSQTELNLCYFRYSQNNVSLQTKDMPVYTPLHFSKLENLNSPPPNDDLCY